MTNSLRSQSLRTLLSQGSLPSLAHLERISRRAINKIQDTLETLGVDWGGGDLLHSENSSNEMSHKLAVRRVSVVLCRAKRSEIVCAFLMKDERNE